MAALPDNAAPPQSDFLQGISGLGIFRQLGLMIGLAASVAIGFAVVLWSQGEDYKPLYANLDKMDPSDVLNILQSNQIDYKVDENSGALLVVADQIHNARLKLAGAGISPDGSFGFEMLDKEQPLGTSQFMENARFKRGLEGELARTIASIRAVRAARVHLALPKTSAFIRDVRKPTASVFLDLYTGNGLSSEQVRAVANMVAFSIPALTIDNVTVVDQRGNLLSNFDVDKDMAMANKQLDYVHQLESRLVKRISSILEPVLGPDRFRAEVSADIDFTQVEQTDELFNPDLPAIRSEQTVEEARGSGGAGGIPGALSNQPPADGQAPEEAGPGEGAGGIASAGTSRRQSVRNYELDRTISHTRHQVGRLNRLSVAVLVDNAASTDAETGEVSSEPLSDAELDQLATLVRDAVGFDATRGDSVNIVNSAFIPKEVVEPVPFEEVPIWQQPELFSYVKQLAGFLFVLLMAILVLRPAMRGLTDTSKNMREMEAQRALGELSGDLGADLSDETVTLSGGDSLMLTGPSESYDQQLNAVKGLIADDPGRVAQVVKKWVVSSE
ncbi:flagellar basal-body MS-ring/collar protein FliF [Oceanicoccus sp. KOV_DT_Chl]|uniref:flagellar basal-body MS-ring/collar protein FliF n=1 Tax=Oceanicoccus sp. KOV_DT_Chl TaxID=1904639 RepID=UPI000C7E1D64|nr:flagellar basal-body MS-ring/collar protein FliF [Oceanicoccus sp. KOV_DT_Chl]